MIDSLTTQHQQNQDKMDTVHTSKTQNFGHYQIICSILQKSFDGLDGMSG